MHDGQAQKKCQSRRSCRLPGASAYALAFGRHYSVHMNQSCASCFIQEWPAGCISWRVYCLRFETLKPFLVSGSGILFRAALLCNLSGNGWLWGEGKLQGGDVSFLHEIHKVHAYVDI
jgi:hypothetical protein